MKNLMQQRVCSSVVAGINTATTLLAGRQVHEETEEMEADLAVQTDAERAEFIGPLEAHLDKLRKKAKGQTTQGGE